MPRPPTDADTFAHLGAVVALADCADNADRRAALVPSLAYTIAHDLAVWADQADNGTATLEHLDRLASDLLRLAAMLELHAGGPRKERTDAPA